MFAIVYTCLPMLTDAYSCLALFTFVYPCLPHVCQHFSLCAYVYPFTLVLCLTFNVYFVSCVKIKHIKQMIINQVISGEGERVDT